MANDGATGGTGAGANGQSGTPAGGGAAGAAGGGNAQWFSTFADPSTRGFVEARGFKDAEALAVSYKNLEALKGVPAEKLIRLPDNMDDAKAISEIHARLGRPEKADGYEVKVPDGVPPDFAEWAKGTFHELGLSKKQGDALAAKWNERIAGMMTKQQEDIKTSTQQQIEKIKSQWGSAYDQKSETVAKFAEAVGLDDKKLNMLDAVLGVDGTNFLLDSIMTKFGIKLGEDGFKGPTGQGGDRSFQLLTPEGARERLAMLKADKEWTGRYLSGGVAERNEMERLIKMSNGEKP